MWTAWLVRGRNDMPSSLLADRVFAVAMIEQKPTNMTLTHDSLPLSTDSKKIQKSI